MPEWFAYAGALLTTIAAAMAAWTAVRAQRTIAVLRDELHSKFEAISVSADVEDPIGALAEDSEDAEQEDR